MVRKVGRGKRSELEAEGSENGNGEERRKVRMKTGRQKRKKVWEGKWEGKL